MISDPMLGRVLHDKYRIDGRLGAGGMATIYRATRLHIGDTVAIKVLHAEVIREPAFAERFRREAQAAARLKHPNVVAIYDFGVADETLYLVMELLEGQDLRTIIKDAGPLSAALAAEIVRQVCAALTEAHRQNIVHRDIKPANMSVESTPDGPRVKVLDFGIASLRSGNTFANLTQTGALLGTPAYMSPEQCLGEELDGRSDIYSLGIVLFEMLCGVAPFNSPTSTAVVMQHVQQAPPALRVLNASISPDVEAVVLRALAKAPQDRFQTARDFAEALTTAAAGPRLTLGPATVATPRFSPPPPDATMMQRPVGAPEPRPNRPSANGRAAGIAIGIGVALAAAVGAIVFQRPIFPAATPHSATPHSAAHRVANAVRVAAAVPASGHSAESRSALQMLEETRELDVLGSGGCASGAVMIRFKDDGTSGCAQLSPTRGPLESGVNVILLSVTATGRGRIFDLLYTDSGERTRFLGTLPGDGSGDLTVSLEGGYIVERNGPREKRSTVRDGRVVPLAVTFAGASNGADDVVRTYYSLWDAHRLPEAYGLLSNRYRTEHPYAAWASSHAGVVHISVQTSRTTDPMAVAVIVQSIDQTPYGTASSEYQGTWRAVYENGATRLDDVALTRIR